MISLFYDDNNKVYLKYYANLPTELKDKEHLEVEVLDDPEEKDGKAAVQYADKDKYWYEYEDKVLDENEALKQRLEDMETTLSIFLGGM